MLGGTDYNDYLDAIAVNISSFLFDDVAVKTTESISNEVRSVHFLNLNNVYMPLSIFLEKVYDSLSKLESDIALRDANIYNDQKTLEMYKYFDGEVKRIDKTLCEQAVYNATQTGAISCIQNQIAQLQSLTKLIVPNTSVCPGWGNVTITHPTTPAA